MQLLHAAVFTEVVPESILRQLRFFETLKTKEKMNVYSKKHLDAESLVLSSINYTLL